jgi:hypothetical protein
MIFDSFVSYKGPITGLRIIFLEFHVVISLSGGRSLC